MVDTFYGLPEKVLFCKKCVISNQRPSSSIEFKHKKTERKDTIAFDNDGICSACKFNLLKNNTINWEEREKKLVSLLDKHRGKYGGYDVIVPSSGGKDSSFTAHILKYKYGMNPLTITWAPHLYTDIGRQNVESLAHVGGIDNILFTPNGRLHRYLTSQAFKNLLHPFQPFIIGQKMIGPLMAMKFNIPLVMYGEHQAEYGNILSETNIPTMDKKFFSEDDPYKISLGGKNILDIIKETNFKFEDFTPYIPPSAKELDERNIQVFHLGYYLKWDPQECYYYSQENTGFKANMERTEGTYSKYASIDDKIDNFHYYTTLIKFGLGRASYDAAQEIRNDKITREEGVALVNKFDLEFPKKYFKDFLEYIDVNENEFHQIVDSFRSPHLWKKRNDNWELLHQVSNL